MLINFGARCAPQNPRIQLLVVKEVLLPSVALMRSTSAQCPQNTQPNLHHYLVPSLILQEATASEIPKPQQVSPLSLETPSGWLRFRIHRQSCDGHTQGRGRLDPAASTHSASLLLTFSAHSVSPAAAEPVFHYLLNGAQSAAHWTMVSGYPMVAFMGLGEKRFTIRLLQLEYFFQIIISGLRPDPCVILAYWLLY